MTPLDISTSSQLLGYTITHIICIYIHLRYPHIATYIDTCTYKNTHTDSDTHTHLLWLGNGMIVIYCCDSWLTIVIMILIS